MYKEKVKARTDGQTLDRQRAMTYARWPMGSGAKNNWNEALIMISDMEMIENIVGKGEIACNSIFSFSQIVFYC